MAAGCVGTRSRDPSLIALVMGHATRIKSVCLFSSVTPPGKPGAGSEAKPPLRNQLRCHRPTGLPPQLQQ